MGHVPLIYVDVDVDIVCSYYNIPVKCDGSQLIKLKLKSTILGEDELFICIVYSKTGFAVSLSSSVGLRQADHYTAPADCI